MPQSWSNKEERQYEHIKDQQKKSGKSSKRAKEVAARTVNKQRRQGGKTSNKTTSGTGNPNSPLENRTVRELRNRASKLHINGRSHMNKPELIDALRKQA